MCTKRLFALVSLFAALTMFPTGQAMAANGTLKLAFKYVDPSSGVEQNLNSAFIYLHDAAKPAPMEKFFSKADYILGPSTFLNGNYSVPVPAGKYYIRVLQRKVISGPLRPYGPPEEGDLTWFQTAPITITASQTLNLGTKYAAPFGAKPITVTGIVRNSTGTPLAGRYVRATTEPCYDQGWDDNINQCGPNKFMALQPTDASGAYTLQLRDPGTYYLSVITNWSTTPGCSGYCAPPIIGTGTNPTAVTLAVGESRTVNVVGY